MTEGGGALLTSEQVAQLARFMGAVLLSGEQLDRLLAAYLDAPIADRQVIQKVYWRQFADAAFVQRVSAAITEGATARQTPRVGGGGGGAAMTSALDAHDERSNGARSHGGSAGTSAATSHQPPRLTHAQMLLSKAVEDNFCKLEGPGPHALEFGVARNDDECARLVELFAARFHFPGPSELKTMVVPRLSAAEVATRTRRRKVGGAYTFYIRVPARGGEYACAVNVTVHKCDTVTFVEMPLFATNIGYKKLGLARLLSAALQMFCCDVGAEWIITSADPNAVPFWRHMGYADITKSVFARIEFYYRNQCHKFKDTELLAWAMSAERDLVLEALARLSDGKFVLQGAKRLPTD